MELSTPARWSVDLGDRERFAVLVLGMRANGIRGVVPFLTFALRVGRALPEMIRNEPRLLGAHTLLAGPLHINLLMYWESAEAVQEWAYARGASHLDWMGRYNRQARAGRALGVYHELYEMSRGQFEAIYRDAPRRGIGAWARVVDGSAGAERSADRMGRGMRAGR